MVTFSLTFWQNVAAGAQQDALTLVVGVVGLANTMALVAIAWRGGAKIGAMSEILARLATDVRELLDAEKERIRNDADLEARVRTLEAASEL